MVPPRVSARILRRTLYARHAPVERRPNRHLRRQVLGDLSLRRDSLFAEASAAKKGKWTTSCAMLIERTPIVMPDPEPWQDAMWELQTELSKFDGFDYPPKVREMYGGKKVPENLREKAVPFPLAPRTTQADHDDDRHSLERALKKSLFLLVQAHDGSWFLPEVPVLETDVLRNAGDRCLETKVGTDLYTYVLGNAPVAVWYRKFHPETDKHLLQEDSDDQSFFGVQQYIMKAIIVDPYHTGPVVLDNQTAVDYAWITKDEFPSYFSTPTGTSSESSSSEDDEMTPSDSELRAKYMEYLL